MVESECSRSYKGLCFFRKYSLSELQCRPPPEGVDPLRLEAFLSAEDFQVGMVFAVSL